MIDKRLLQTVRTIPDFPKPGIQFKDITPIFQDPGLTRDLVETIAGAFRNDAISAVVGIESRGFLAGLPVALALDVPFVLVRKQGKLPYTTVTHAYDLEYGSAVIEMHTDSIRRGDRVLVHDDLLATGGTAAAAAELVGKQDGVVAGYSFIFELEALNGRRRLPYPEARIHTLAAV